MKCLFLLLFVSLFFNCAFATRNQLSLKVAGEDVAGYHVDIYNSHQKLVTNTEEFSLQLFNNDLSTVANIPQWKGQKWSGNKNSITLKRDAYVKEFDANLSVNVNYQVVNSNIIKKTIGLFFALA